MRLNPSNSPASFLDWRMRASPRTSGHPGRRTTNASVPTGPEFAVSTSRPLKTAISSTRGLVPNLMEMSTASWRAAVIIVLGIIFSADSSLSQKNVSMQSSIYLFDSWPNSESHACTPAAAPAVSPRGSPIFCTRTYPLPNHHREPREHHTSYIIIIIVIISIIVLFWFLVSGWPLRSCRKECQFYSAPLS